MTKISPGDTIHSVDRVLKVPVFNRWMLKSGLTDRALIKAVDEIKNGLIDADLGGGILKKRLALPGRGKRGSARTLLASNKRGRWVFLFGFQKNERDNISRHELEALQELSSDLMMFSEPDISLAVSRNELFEVSYETKK